MNDKQWALIAEFMQLALQLLNKIEKNTRPEDFEEKKNRVRGFEGTD